ncbi:hypothetical protein BU15DRAFT_63689 [Melanogaster broomeanus]|nr:hypothetical protein BU15DRAFT_63689 [Melanogaster broomeanus]
MSLKLATSAQSSGDRPLRNIRTQLFVGTYVSPAELELCFAQTFPFTTPRTVLLMTAKDVGCAIDMLNDYCWHMQGTSIVSAIKWRRERLLTIMQWRQQRMDFKDLFRAAGAVARADAALGPDGRSRGFSTVTFITEGDAARGRMFDGYEFNGRPLKVHFDKFANSSTPIPLAGVPHSGATSLSPYESLPQAGLVSQLSLRDEHHANPLDVHAYPYLDALTLVHIDRHQRSHLDPTSLDTRTSAQLDALLMQSRSSPAFPSITPSATQMWFTFTVSIAFTLAFCNACAGPIIGWPFAQCIGCTIPCGYPYSDHARLPDLCIL